MFFFGFFFLLLKCNGLVEFLLWSLTVTDLLDSCRHEVKKEGSMVWLGETDPRPPTQQHFHLTRPKPTLFNLARPGPLNRSSNRSIIFWNDSHRQTVFLATLYLDLGNQHGNLGNLVSSASTSVKFDDLPFKLDGQWGLIGICK